MNSILNSYHIPVLLQECIDGLNILPSGIYVDATFGGGGHSLRILSKLSMHGRLLSFDRDADAEINIINDERFVFVRSDFRYLSNFLRYHNIIAVDGILADLGVSWHQFDNAERGFTFRANSLLDMRMNNRKGKTAADILNSYDEKSLANMFYKYGELTSSKRIATAIVQHRENKAITTVEDFLFVLKPFIIKEREKQFLAKTFQALRIEVNNELDALHEFLLQSVKALKIGGRLAIITYHSLEDRMVKHFIKTGNPEGIIKQDVYGNRFETFKVVGKMLTPSQAEIEQNPRSRSAKLRIGEKI